MGVKVRKIFMLVAIVLVILCPVIVFYWGCSAPISSEKGSLYATKIFKRDNLTIRVCAYHEATKGWKLPGAYIVFEILSGESGKWVQILEFEHDGPVPIPPHCVRFVNDKIAYAFIGWMFTVTLDGGRSWEIWNAEKNLEEWLSKEEYNYQYIQDIDINVSGYGIMHLNPIRWKEVQRLYTKDWGQHWGIANSGKTRREGPGESGKEPREKGDDEKDAGK